MRHLDWVLAQTALDQMGASSVQDVIDGNVSFTNREITIIGSRNGRCFASHVLDASIVEWNLLLPSYRIIKGKVPLSLLE